MINDIGQTGEAVAEFLLLVLFEKEFCIRQTRAHDALIAFNNVARIVSGDVGDNQKPRAQFARRIGQRKIFLIGLHGQDQTFLRHR